MINYKRLLFILLILFSLSFTSVNALLSTPSNMFVSDEAKVLNKDTEDYINKYSYFLYEIKSVDFYVVSLKNVEGYNLDEYVQYIYDSFDLSEKGILIVLSISDRVINVKVGSRLSYFITDEIVNEYIADYFMPYFKNGDWDKGMINGYKAFYKLICNYYDIDSSDMIVYDGMGFINKYKNYILVFVVWFNTIISYIFCSFFIRLYINSKHKNTTFDFMVFGLSLFINILMFVLAYLVNPFSIILVLCSELFSIYGNYFNNKNNKILVKSTPPKKAVMKKKPKSLSVRKGSK